MDILFRSRMTEDIIYLLLGFTKSMNAGLSAVTLYFEPVARLLCRRAVFLFRMEHYTMDGTMTIQPGIIAVNSLIIG